MRSIRMPRELCLEQLEQQVYPAHQCFWLVSSCAILCQLDFSIASPICLPCIGGRHGLQPTPQAAARDKVAFHLCQ